MGINLFKSPYGCFYWSLPTPPGIFRHWKNFIDLIFKAEKTMFPVVHYYSFLHILTPEQKKHASQGESWNNEAIYTQQ